MPIFFEKKRSSNIDLTFKITSKMSQKNKSIYKSQSRPSDTHHRNNNLTNFYNPTFTDIPNSKNQYSLFHPNSSNNYPPSVSSNNSCDSQSKLNNPKKEFCFKMKKTEEDGVIKWIDDVTVFEIGNEDESEFESEDESEIWNENKLEFENEDDLNLWYKDPTEDDYLRAKKTLQKERCNLKWHSKLTQNLPFLFKIKSLKEDLELTKNLLLAAENKDRKKKY